MRIYLHSSRAVSQQGFKREDTLLIWKLILCTKLILKKYLRGNVKGGVNYNISETSNVFVNSGFYSKQPFFNAVYPNNQSV
jgi:hypothetical protein